MKLIILLFHLIGKLISMALILAICLPLLFVVVKGNQPMSVPQVPKGMTYWEFISDRLDAAKTGQPSRCGWGMFLSLGVLGLIYSVVYTDVAIHPNGYLAKVTAPDTDIPKGVANASWIETPEYGGKWWRDYPGPCWPNKRLVAGLDRYMCYKSKV
jgi:hypothetical protein